MQNISFGEMETKALFALEEREAGIITFDQLVKSLKLTHVQTRGLTSRLVRKHRLIRIKRGTFLFAPMKSGPKGEWTEDSLAAIEKLMGGKDYYVSFWLALNHYGLTEQIPYTIQIVTKTRQRNFEALQTRFEFTTVRHFGEWREEKIREDTFRIATMEQLIIDCLAMPDKCSGLVNASQAIWTAQDKLDWDKLETLAAKSNDAVRRRLGYICDLLKLHKMKPLKPVGWRWLDPSRANKEKISESKKWGLLVNVSDKVMTQWMES